MKRFDRPNINTSEEYDRIFKERETKEPHWQDMRRWKLLVNKFKGGRILDIGCLDSMVPVMARKKHKSAECWGIDSSKYAIEAMNKELGSWVHYRVEDLYKMDFPYYFFDYVVMGEVLEHLEDPQGAIKEAMRVLKPGGTLVVSVPLNETELGEVDKERHIWSFGEQDMYDLLSQYGSVQLRVVGSIFIPFYKYAFPNVIAYCTKM